MLKAGQDRSIFSWKDLGDIAEGRPNLGLMTTVTVYRLMQYTLRATLASRYGAAQADEVLYESGHLAGTAFCKNLLDTAADFDSFASDLSRKMEMFFVGILRFEKSDMERKEFILTLSEDLDCSGLPVSGKTVCAYDEGFIAGIFDTYTGREFDVREIDCWAAGARICRFRAAAKT